MLHEWEKQLCLGLLQLSDGILVGLLPLLEGADSQLEPLELSMAIQEDTCDELFKWVVQDKLGVVDVKV